MVRMVRTDQGKMECSVSRSIWPGLNIVGHPAGYSDPDAARELLVPCCATIEFFRSLLELHRPRKQTRKKVWFVRHDSSYP